MNNKSQYEFLFRNANDSDLNRLGFSEGDKQGNHIELAYEYAMRGDGNGLIKALKDAGIKIEDNNFTKAYAIALARGQQPSDAPEFKIGDKVIAWTVGAPATRSKDKEAWQDLTGKDVDPKFTATVKDVYPGVRNAGSPVEWMYGVELLTPHGGTTYWHATSGSQLQPATDFSSEEKMIAEIPTATPRDKNSEEDIRARINELVEKHKEGTLTPEEKGQLEILLRSSLKFLHRITQRGLPVDNGQTLSEGLNLIKAKLARRASSITREEYLEFLKELENSGDYLGAAEFAASTGPREDAVKYSDLAFEAWLQKNEALRDTANLTGAQLDEEMAKKIAREHSRGEIKRMMAEALRIRDLRASGKNRHRLGNILVTLKYVEETLMAPRAEPMRYNERMNAPYFPYGRGDNYRKY